MPDMRETVMRMLLFVLLVLNVLFFFFGCTSWHKCNVGDGSPGACGQYKGEGQYAGFLNGEIERLK